VKKFLFISCMALGLAAGGAASAGPITLLQVGAGGVAGDHILGEVIPPVYADGQLTRDAAMVDELLSMALGERTPVGLTPEYYRSETDFGYLPPVTTDRATFASGIATMTAVGEDRTAIAATRPYAYLVAKWDGKHAGVQVWYIGDAEAGTTFEIPRYAMPVPASGQNPQNVWPQDLVDGYGAAGGSKHQISSWSLLTPVPDGGATLALLGLALAGLGLARRYLA
jgi:hypothetical protein